MQARPPQSVLGWTIYFAMLVAVTLLLFLGAPALAQRMKPAIAVMWFFGVVFFVVWRIDQRGRSGGKPKPPTGSS